MICFGCGILVGLPLFFILRNVLPASAAALIMIVVMMPFFLFAMYEKNGEPLEKVLRHIYDARMPQPKQITCLFVRLNRNLVLTWDRSLGIVT